MTAEDLYDAMKRALEFFGLRFHQMGRVLVSYEKDALVFTYNGDAVRVEIK